LWKKGGVPHLNMFGKLAESPNKIPKYTTAWVTI
jgi:hypothetical protein